MSQAEGGANHEAKVCHMALQDLSMRLKNRMEGAKDGRHMMDGVVVWSCA